MEPTANPAALAGAAPAPAQSAVPVVQSAAAGPKPALAVGDTIQATVLAAQSGRLRLQWQGLVFDALSALALGVGQTYALRVSAVQPQVVLTAGRAPPENAAAAAGGMLGIRALDWSQPLRQLLAAAAAANPRSGIALLAAGAGTDLALRTALAGLASPTPRGADLRTLHEQLGHDQEVRVLRLPDATFGPAAMAEVAVLRQTGKAVALQIATAPEGQPEVRRQPAAALVVGLGQIERDNAARAEQGAPLWLPLPAAPQLGLRDARMFVLPRPADGGADAANAADVAAGQPFTVVLLLDLSRLGGMRVDVALRGEEVTAVFTVARPATLHRLTIALGELRAAMEHGGLRIGGLQVRQAPEQRLPVADLVLRPRNLDALVDLHA